jgi:hypothetical protein
MSIIPPYQKRIDLDNLQESNLLLLNEARKLKAHGFAGSLLSFTCLFIASAMK